MNWTRYLKADDPKEILNNSEQTFDLANEIDILCNQDCPLILEKQKRLVKNPYIEEK